MVRWLLLFLLFFIGQVHADVEGLSSPTVEGLTQPTVESVAHGATAPASLIFHWECESTTLASGTTDFVVSGGDTTATLNSSAAINTSAVKSGTNGLDIPTASDFASFSNDNDITSETEGTLSAWFYVNTWAADFVLLRPTLNGGSEIRVNLRNTDELEAVWRDGVPNAIETTSANLTTGNWYFFTYQYDQVAGSHTLKVFNSAGTQLDSVTASETLAAINLNSSTLKVGDDSGGAGDVYIDHVLIFNDASVSAEDYRNCTTYSSCGW